jgi:cytochrome c oxidase subunit 3
MPDVLTKPLTKTGSGGVGIGGDVGGFGGGGGGGEESAPLFDTAKVGLWAFLGSLTMLFAAFTSAFIVRRAGTDWAPLQVPSVLWVNTAVLLLSSVTIELGRRAFESWRPLAFRKWMSVTFVLGGLFIGGQLFAWRQLAEQGIFLQSNPHSSFFYVLTGVHVAHVVGGIIALLYALLQSWRYRLTPGASSAPALCATYWHFVDAAWIYLFFVLFVI